MIKRQKRVVYQASGVGPDCGISPVHGTMFSSISTKDGPRRTLKQQID